MYLYMLAEDLHVKGLPHVYMSASLYDKLVASRPFPQFSWCIDVLCAQLFCGLCTLDKIRMCCNYLVNACIERNCYHWSLV